MYYIYEAANESGNHGNPVSVQSEGMAALPDELLGAYIETKGFCTLTVEEGAVAALVIDQEAYDAYMAGHPEGPRTIRADRLYAAGQYLTIDGTLHRATLDIPAGSAIVPGGNCEATTIETELNRISEEG